MSPELFVLYCSGIAAFFTAWQAWATEDKKIRRRMIPATLLLALFTVVAGIESYFRKAALDDYAQEQERKWTLLQDAELSGIEFEFLTADGVFDYKHMSNYLPKISFEIAGVAFGSTLGMPAEKVEFSQIFSLERLTSLGRLGTARATMRKPGEPNGVATLVSSVCTTSRQITQETLKNIRANVTLESTSLICSMTVALPILKPGLRLSQIAASQRLTLQVDEPNQMRCVGPCKNSKISIRLLFSSRLNESIFPEMVELSPMSYAPLQARISGTALVFELSGSSVVALAKSYFMQTYGFLDRAWFPVTRGLLYGWYKELTMKKERAAIFDIIWTTDERPDEKLLMNAIDPEKRAKAEFFQASEWCGFGDGKTCWRRFVALEH